jgi:hypothetical protein
MERLISVKRVAVIDPGSFGVMMFKGVPFAVTLERTFLVNGQQTIIIPFGISVCKKDFYNAGGYPTFEIIVPGHDRVLFHKLNLETESKGCMGIGEQFGVLKGQPAILQS